MPDNNEEKKTLLQQVQAKLGVISSIVASVAVIVGGFVTIQNSDYGIPTKGWVERAMQEDNELQDRQAIEARAVVLEGELRTWIIQFVDLNETRRRLDAELVNIDTLIQKSIDNENEDTNEHQILLNLRQRTQQELDEIDRSLDINQ